MLRTCSFPSTGTAAWPHFQHAIDLRTVPSHSRGSGSGHSRLTLEHNDTVSQVRGHDEVVFDDECCLLSVEDVPVQHKKVNYRGICGVSRSLFIPLDDFAGDNTLF